MPNPDRVEPQVIATLPMAAGRLYAVTLEDYRTLERVFAEVDVVAELRIMQQWCETHPKIRHRVRTAYGDGSSSG